MWLRAQRCAHCGFLSLVSLSRPAGTRHPIHIDSMRIHVYHVYIMLIHVSGGLGLREYMQHAHNTLSIHVDLIAKHCLRTAALPEVLPGMLRRATPQIAGRWVSSKPCAG